MPEEPGQAPLAARSVTSEVRIGLAMSGAIALVLYEAGVTHEVFRLTKAWQAFCEGRETPSTTAESGSEGYYHCLRAIPIRPVVDILTGASAGAVNSTLLASCLAGGTDFVRYHDILLTKLDVDALKYKRNDTPKGLMDSRILLKVLEEELGRNARAAISAPAGRGMDICVRLCRTHLAGHCETTRDAIGHQIDVETRSDVIEFSGEDFLDSARIPDIARATLASAAFPGAFGPVRDEHDLAWYVDGGLWDNQPVDWAVDAVKDKPAFLRTHRCILFVEPNPPARSADHAQPGGEKEPALSDILLAIPFMGVKGNVWPAIRDLMDYGRRSRVYSGLVREPALRRLTRNLGGQWITESALELAAAVRLTDSLRNGTWRDAAPIAPGILSQVRIDAVLLDNDPALIQRWHAINEAWNALGLRVETGVDVPIFFRRDDHHGSEDAPTPACAAALAALNAVGCYDLDRRAVRRRVDVTNDALHQVRGSDEQDRIGRVMVPRKAALYARLDRLNNYLYIKADPSEMPSEAAPFDVNRPRDAQTTDWPTYHSRLVRFHSRFRTATVQMLNDLEFAFRYLFQVPSRATDAESQTAEISRILADPLKDPVRALVKWVDAISAAASAARTASGVDEPLSAAPANMQVWRLLDSVRPLGISTDDEELVRPAVTRAAQIRYTKVDAVRYVLAAVSDLSNKKPMDLVRVSPNDTNNLYLVTSEECTDVTPAVRKLAGEGLGHLQGFLEERWRRNDYIWGRLDACEILLRTMRLYSEREGRPWKERDYEDALYLAQQAILKQEAELYAERLKQLGRRARRKWSFTDAQKAADELERLKPGHLPEPLMRVGSIHRSRPLEAEGEAQP